MKTSFSEILRSNFFLCVFFSLVLLWLGCFYFAFPLLTKSESIGTFGDFFGCFNSLVSLLGFGAVIYSLQRQHGDAKEAEQRHGELIERQQHFFEQNANISLFEKRMKVYIATRMLIELIAAGPKVCIEDAREFSLHTIRAQFLFSESSDILAYLSQIQIRAQKLVQDEEYMKRESAKEHNLTENKRSKFEFQVWCSNQLEGELERIFSSQLSIAYILRDPSK